MKLLTRFWPKFHAMHLGQSSNITGLNSTSDICQDHICPVFSSNFYFKLNFFLSESISWHKNLYWTKITFLSFFWQKLNFDQILFKIYISMPTFLARATSLYESLCPCVCLCVYVYVYVYVCIYVTNFRRCHTTSYVVVRCS